MQLHRTYGQCHADVTALDWSEDSHWIAAASKDLSARQAELSLFCFLHVSLIFGAIDAEKIATGSIRAQLDLMPFMPNMLS